MATGTGLCTGTTNNKPSARPGFADSSWQRLCQTAARCRYVALPAVTSVCEWTAATAGQPGQRERGAIRFIVHLKTNPSPSPFSCRSVLNLVPVLSPLLLAALFLHLGLNAHLSAEFSALFGRNPLLYNDLFPYGLRTYSDLFIPIVLKSAMDRCRIPDDCIDSRRYPLFMDREVMRGLIEQINAQVPGQRATSSC